jgi:DNA-binding MarR family transcriptional regulator
MKEGDINLTEYRALADFRYNIRRYLRFSEHAARQSGLEPQQYQFLLAVKGMPDDVRATVGELAERMQIQHHSTVELVDRMTERGLVTRKRGSEDRREVIVQLSAKGDKLLRDLVMHHRNELRDLAPNLAQALRKIMATSSRGSSSKKVSDKVSDDDKKPRRSTRTEGATT